MKNRPGSLRQIRKSRSVRQDRLGQAIGTKQTGVSRMEVAKNLRVDTLRKYVEGLGGELKLIAAFPDAEIVITQFDEVGSFRTKRLDDEDKKEKK